MNDINEIAKDHYEFLKEMGWTKATPLESLALIASEIGEAVNECRGEKPTERLGEELADIVLRTLGLASRFDIDMAAEIAAKMKKNRERGSRGRII